MSATQRRELLLALRNDCLQENDVLVSIDDRAIDLQMMSMFENIWSDRIGFQSGMDRLRVGDTVKLTYYRPGETETRTSRMVLHSAQNMFRQLFADADDAKYVVMAGVFVMPLSINHISLIRGGEALVSLVTRPDVKNESVLIITHILPQSPFQSADKAIVVGDMIVGINGFNVQNMDDLTNAWAVACQETVVTLRTRHGSLTSASRDQIQYCESKVRAERGEAYAGYHACNVFRAPAAAVPPVAPAPVAAAPPVAPAPVAVVAPPAPAPVAAAPAPVAVVAPTPSPLENEFLSEKGNIILEAETDDASVLVDSVANSSSTY